MNGNELAKWRCRQAEPGRSPAWMQQPHWTLQGLASYGHAAKCRIN